MKYECFIKPGFRCAEVEADSASEAVDFFVSTIVDSIGPEHIVANNMETEDGNDHPEHTAACDIPADKCPVCIPVMVRPWIGNLHHARGPSDDWGMIRDEEDNLILLVNLPSHDPSVMSEHRRNGTDPTQERVDAILAAVNPLVGHSESKKGVRQ